MRNFCGMYRFLLVFFVLVPVSVFASGLRDVDDGWLLSDGEIVTMLAGNNPDLGLPYSDGYGLGSWARVGGMQLFSMPELPARAVGLGLRMGNDAVSWFLGGQWQRTGSGIFVADSQRLIMGWKNHRMIGLLLERIAWGIDQDANDSWLGVKVVWSPAPIRIGIYTVGGSLQLPCWSSGDWREFERRQSRFKLHISRGHLIFSGSMDKKSDSGWALGIEICLTLVPGLGLTVRADPDTGALGPGTLWVLGNLLFKTSHVTHPDLGLTHRVTLTAGALGAVPW